MSKDFLINEEIGLDKTIEYLQKTRKIANQNACKKFHEEEPCEITDEIDENDDFDEEAIYNQYLEEFYSFYNDDFIDYLEFNLEGFQSKNLEKFLYQWEWYCEGNLSTNSSLMYEAATEAIEIVSEEIYKDLVNYCPENVEKILALKLDDEDEWMKER